MNMREHSIIIHRTRRGVQDYFIQFTFEYTEEDNQWVGVCLEIGTSAYADTLDEARQELGDAVVLQLGEAERLGFVSQFLSDNHVTLLEPQPKRTPGFSLVG